MNSMKTNKLSPDEINGLLGQKVMTDKMISESLLSNVEMEALTEFSMFPLEAHLAYFPHYFLSKLQLRLLNYQSSNMIIY